MRAVCFERVESLVRLVQFGIPFLIPLPGVLHFLRSCRFRLHRLGENLLRTTRPDILQKRVSLVPGTLFMGESASANNIEFRHNFYWASRCSLCLLAVPCLVLWTAGVAVALTVRPISLGLSIVSIGTTILAFLYAIRLWQLECWRLTRATIAALAIGIGGVSIFPVLMLFLGPKSIHTSQVNFPSLIMILLSLGLVPRVLEAIEFNSRVCCAKEMLAISLAAATNLENGTSGELQDDYWLMKECYSASSELSHFDFVPDVAGSLCGFSNHVNSKETAALRRALLRTACRVTLLVLTVGAFAFTVQGYIALIVVVFLHFTDTMDYYLGVGHVSWSPGKAICLTVVARTLIILFGARLWVVGLSTVYCVYGISLMCEIVNKHLPYLDNLKACGVLFLIGGQRRVFSTSADVVGTPEFALGGLTATFFMIILVAGFARPPGVSMPNVRLNSQFEVPVYIFPVVAWLSVTSAGTFFGFARAAYLDSQNLLVGSAATAYFMFPFFDLPKMLAGFSYLCLLAAGFLLWEATQTPAIFVVFAHGPPLLLCLFNTARVWLTNDCQLVIWPPQASRLVANDDSSESILAFDVLQVMMGSLPCQLHDANASNVLRAPYLVRNDGSPDAASIQIPMLPPKSTMRKAAAARNLYVTVQRHQVVDLGLQARRMQKVTQRIDDRTRKRTETGLSAPLTFAEVCSHLACFACKQLSGEYGDSSELHNLEPSNTPAGLDVPLWEAILTGCLLADEYGALICAMSAPFLVFSFGGLLAHLLQPCVGHILWISTLSVSLITYPIVKWLIICQITGDMRYASVIGSCLFVGMLGWAIRAWLNAQMSVVTTLLILDALILYPLCLVAVASFLQWIDRGCKELDHTVQHSTHGDVMPPKKQSMTCRLPSGLAQASRKVLILCILVQIYLWVSPCLAFTSFTIFFWLWAVLYFVHTWANNDFFLPQKLLQSADNVILGSSIMMAILFLTLTNAAARAALSLTFALQLCRCVTKVIHLAAHLDMDTVFWCAPTLFPIYSFSVRDKVLLDETQLAKCFCTFFGIGICWGAALVCFVYPISLGIGLVSAFVSCAVAASAIICVHLPLKLGSAASCLSPCVFRDSASLAIDDYNDRIKINTLKFETHCVDWSDLDGCPQACGNVDRGSSAKAITMQIKAAEKALTLSTLEGTQPVWRADALYTDQDGVAETCTSRGPFGCLGPIARLSKVDYMYLRGFDVNGRRVLAQETVGFEASQAIIQLLDLDASFCHYFEVELKSLILFHMLVLTATETFFTQEQVLFQQFLQETRFKLLANGLCPPIAVHCPHGSFNASFIACWLQSLCQDQQERFYLLKANYKLEQTDQELKVLEYDRGETIAAMQLAERRLDHERHMLSRYLTDSLSRRAKRCQTWTASLSEEDQHHFNTVLRDQWENNIHSVINPRDAFLRQSYQLHVLLEGHETVGNCRERLAELEAGEIDCYPSKTRKGALQFVDPDFKAGLDALGCCFGVNFIGMWSHALSVNPHAVLFGETCEPEDIHPGSCVDDSWLLSALTILTGGGEIDGIDFDSRIKELFINMVDLEGNVVYDSAVGAFGLKLFVNGQWEAIIVDDALPMLGDGSIGSGVNALVALDAHKHEKMSLSSCLDCKNSQLKLESTDSFDPSSIESHKQRYKDCAGSAVAHTLEMAQLWVSLLEKGVAKYYGSYGSIEAGFVHQGLELFTGHHAECLHIIEASRGMGKHSLWSTMLRSRGNGYILGANAVLAEHARLSLQASGLLFGATYSVLEIVDVFPERHKLVKLRNPIGHRQLFRGIWSLSSTIWTKRLRHKLLQNQEHQTFWVSFDEFCCAFRCLLICHYFNETSVRWKKHMASGEWTCNQLDRHENTAPGLPSPHNPGCEVERNPQYSVTLHRPSTLRISIVQVDTKGHAVSMPLPIAGYLCNAIQREDGRVDRITKLSYHNVICSTGKARPERQVGIYVDKLKPGAYVLLVGAFQAEMEGKFTLSITSNHEIAFGQIWPPAWRSISSL